MVYLKALMTNDRISKALTCARIAHACAGSYRNSINKARFPGGAQRVLHSYRRTTEGALSSIASALEEEDSAYLDQGSLGGLFSAGEFQISNLVKILRGISRPDMSTEPTARDAILISIVDETDSLSKVDIRTVLTKFEMSGDRADNFLTRIRVASTFLEYAKEYANVTTSSQGTESLRRSIEFSPEYRQAGISILSYFGEILDSKYSGIEAHVAIEQKGSIVTLVVSTPEGMQERIDKDFSDYMLVVSGVRTPQSLLRSQSEVMRLEQKLELASLEARHTRELMMAERDGFSSQVETLKDCLALVSEQLTESRQISVGFAADLRDSSIGTSENVASLVESLIESVKRSEDPNEAADICREIHSIDTDMSARIQNLLVKGGIYGASGNFLYDVMIALGKLV